jgi:hypothetical protein
MRTHNAMIWSQAQRLAREEGKAARLLSLDESWNPYSHEMPEYRGLWASGWSERNAQIRNAFGGAQQQLRRRSQ